MVSGYRQVDSMSESAIGCIGVLELDAAKPTTKQNTELGCADISALPLVR